MPIYCVAFNIYINALLRGLTLLAELGSGAERGPGAFNVLVAPLTDKSIATMKSAFKTPQRTRSCGRRRLIER